MQTTDYRCSSKSKMLQVVANTIVQLLLIVFHRTRIKTLEAAEDRILILVTAVHYIHLGYIVTWVITTYITLYISLNCDYTVGFDTEEQPI